MAGQLSKIAVKILFVSPSTKALSFSLITWSLSECWRRRAVLATASVSAGAPSVFAELSAALYVICIGWCTFCFRGALGGSLLLDIGNVISSDVKMLDDLMLLNKEEKGYNTRLKCWVDDEGIEHPYELMCSSRRIFGGGFELSDFSKEVEWRLEYEEANAELFGGAYGKTSHFKPQYQAPPDPDEARKASLRRARRKIFDYSICNPFDCFVTLTLDKALIDRGDYSAVIKRLSTYLDNRVRRQGLIYLGVPELHQNGGIHFHFLMNSTALRLTDSGTVSVEGRKKPIKIATANRLQIPDDKRHTVYNVEDWKLGFSTAIMTYGDRGAVSRYISKELNKTVQKSIDKDGKLEKIGGRWYLSGGKLRKPIVKMFNSNFEAVDGETYSYDCPVAQLKVFNFNEDGSTWHI